MKSKFFKITDTTDLEQIKKTQEVKDFKGRILNTDASKKTKCKSYKNSFYVLATTSDKEINSRTYDDESLYGLVMSNSWTEPYNKPLLKHHNQYSGEPLGRTILSYYINHETLEVSTNAEEPLPENVIKFYQDKKAFDVGKSSVILKCFCSDEEYERILSGLDSTVSQGIYCEKLVCNVCGESYFDCNHSAGRVYEIEGKGNVKCVPVAKGIFEAAEISIVNVPANDTSIIYVPEENKDNTNNKKQDDKQEEIDKNEKEAQNSTKIDKNFTICEDGASDDLIVLKDKQPEGDSVMYKDMLKKTLLDNLKRTFADKETLANSFSELFDSINDEEGIEKLTNLINAFKDEFEELKASKKEEDSKEPEPNPEPNPVADQSTPAEIPKEPEVENPTQDSKTILENEVKDLSNKTEKTENKEIVDSQFRRFFENNL